MLYIVYCMHLSTCILTVVYDERVVQFPCFLTSDYTVHYMCFHSLLLQLYHFRSQKLEMLKYQRSWQLCGSEHTHTHTHTHMIVISVYFMSDKCLTLCQLTVFSQKWLSCIRLVIITRLCKTLVIIFIISTHVVTLRNSHCALQCNSKNSLKYWNTSHTSRRIHPIVHRGYIP